MPAPVRRLTRLALATMLIAGVAQLPARAGEPARYSRLHLFADQGNYLWWDVDAASAEADRRSITRTCPSSAWGHPGAAPCLMGLAPPQVSYNLWFNPHARLTEELVWDAASPLRFRFRLDVLTVPAYTVHLAYWDGASPTPRQSAAATQVSPGVWEGTLATGAPLFTDRGGQFGVRVLLSSPAPAQLTMATDGSSYIDAPTPAAGLSWRDLVRRDPVPPATTAFTSALNSFRFNDGRWAVTTFQGTLAETRTFTAQLERPAAAVVAWAETTVGGTVYRAGRGEAAPESATDRMLVTLKQDGTELAHGRNYVSGGDTAVAMNVPTGPVEMSVTPGTGVGQQPTAYKAYVLVIEGERTLQSMRTRFDMQQALRVPGTAVCPPVIAPIPITSTVTAFTIDLDWEHLFPNQAYVPRFSLPSGDIPCSEMGTGPQVSLVRPVQEPEVFWVGATPAYDHTFASVRDAVVDAEVRLIHDPFPPA